MLGYLMTITLAKDIVMIDFSPPWCKDIFGVCLFIIIELPIEMIFVFIIGFQQREGYSNNVLLHYIQHLRKYSRCQRSNYDLQSADSYHQKS